MSMYRPAEQEVLLTPAEVAKLFRVDPKTVTRWAKAGKLTAIRTLGGHRRYRQSEVQNLLNAKPQNQEQKRMSTSDNSDDMKAKFREALAKKKSGGSKKGEAAGEKSKIRDVDAHGNTPKMFRRKSGSA